MTVRFTVLCPKLALHKAKGISPDDAKTMNKSDIAAQTKINESYNARGAELGTILTTKLSDCDISWINNGQLVVSCTNSLAEVEAVIDEEGLEIKPDRSDIGHKQRQLDENDLDSNVEEDIDEIFEPKNANEKKKLKKKSVVNKYKLNKVV